MNNVLRLGAGLSKSAFVNRSKQCGLNFINRSKITTACSRGMWHACSSNSRDGPKFLKQKPVSECPQCGCSGLLHTKGEKSLVDFLQTEIVEERKAQKKTSLPSELNGFAISADEAELVFTKKNKLETVTVNLNVNYSVDTDEGGSEDAYADEMKSKPTFEVDIIRNNSTLRFSCSYVNFTEADGDKVDVYQIDEVTLFEGKWNEKNYSVAGNILDENLYDLFMTFLFEKGITKEFIEEVSEIATYYEHSKYIGLLEEIRKFSSAN